MSQHLRDDLRMNATPQQKRRCGVAQIMKADARQPCLVDNTIVGPEHVWLVEPSPLTGSLFEFACHDTSCPSARLPISHAAGVLFHQHVSRCFCWSVLATHSLCAPLVVHLLRHEAFSGGE